MGDELMDYTERCRLCIAGSKRLSIDIFSPEGKRSKLQAKISKYLSVKISEDDKLPSSICYQCLFRLETWVSFKKLCMDSDQTLKNWAFFCGAITPESYLNEANKSPENGSDLEKPNTPHFCPKNDNSGVRARTPLGENSALAPVSSEQEPPSHEDAASPPAPLSSASSSSSRTRGSEPTDKTSKAKDSTSPLNGITREPQARTSKPGRRKVLRPNKAVPSSPPKDEQDVADRAEKDIPQGQLEESKVKAEEPTRRDSSDSSPGLFVKRKRGRPSKAWLKERAEALKKLKEGPEPLEPLKSEESPSEKRSPHKAVTELIELDDPDFGSMKFTLSVIDSAVVSPSEKGTSVVYPESSTSVSSGRLSSDSCFKEEFSGFSIPKVDANPETGKSPCSTPRDTLQERLSESGDMVTSPLRSSPGKLERKRSHSALSVCSGEEVEEKLKKSDDFVPRRMEHHEGVESVKPVSASELPRPSPSSSSERDLSEDAHVEQLEEEDRDALVVGDVNPVPSSYPPEMSTDTDTKDEIATETDPQLDDDSDSDLAAPPMSPLSPLRVEFQVIELPVETEERSSECEC